MTASVGFVGVGNMGNPMAANVLKAGFPMTVFDRHPPAMENLVQAGAQRAASAREVVERCEIVETFNTIAKELHVPVSFSNVAQRYQQAAMAAGLADHDTSVVMTIIERLAAVEVRRAGA